MSHFKQIPAPLLLLALVLAGAASVLAGVHMLWGLAPTLILGGVVAVAVGLLVDH